MIQQLPGQVTKLARDHPEELLYFIREVGPKATLKHKKHYIGLGVDGALLTVCNPNVT